MIFVMSFVWIGAFGASLIIPFSLSGMHIGHTHYCTLNREKLYGVTGIISSAVCDMMMCLAISIKPMMSVPNTGIVRRFRAAMNRKGSKGLLSGEQLYYTYAFDQPYDPVLSD